MKHHSINSIRFIILAITLILCAIVSFVKFNLIISHDNFSDRLLKESLTRYEKMGDADIGGFMVAFEEKVHIAAVKNVLGDMAAPRAAYPYVSNFNGQYDVAKSFIDLFGLSAANAALAFSVLSVIGLIVVTYIIYYAVSRDFGKRAGTYVLLLFVLSPALWLRSFSTYWVIFLSLLPFALSLLFYPQNRTGFRFALLLAGIFVAIFVKSLTGYEYLTCITLSAMVPVFYYEIQQGGYKSAPIIKFITRSFLIGVAAIMGFALAVYFHLDKMAHYFGSFDKAINAIELIASYSSFKDNAIREGSPDTLSFIATWVKTYLLYNFLITSAISAWAAYLLLKFFRSTDPDKIKPAILSYLRSPIFGATALSFLATISWTVLMVKHATVHSHINWIQAYMCMHIFVVINLANLEAHLFPSQNGQPTVRH